VTGTSRDALAERDARDPLAAVRERFLLPDGVVYLDGNSLGALPDGVPERMRRVVEEEWGRDLIRSWNVHAWVDLPRTVGDRIARLIGAPAGSVVATDSTSVNLYKAVRAARALRPDRAVVLTDTGNFPTDRYVLEGIAEVRAVPPAEVASAIDETVAVVALTEVDYRTGRRHDMAGLTDSAHAAGALSVWDLAHSAGAFPVELEGCDVDLAVGCGYKYLNGGPGAPAFLYVAPRLHGAYRNPIQGWFGHADPFSFSSDFTPAHGIDRGRIGTPHVLSLVALDEALRLWDEIDLGDVRRTSEELTSLFIDLAGAACPSLELLTPRDPARRGSQVSFRHPGGHAIVQALVDRGVIGDFRAPDVLRFGLAPLYVRRVDVYDAVDVLGDVMASGAWRDPRYAVRNRVT
jgi:kynureninase